MTTPTLQQAAIAYIAVRNQYLDDDLREELAAAEREFRKRFPNLQWHVRPGNHLDVLAAELARLTGDNRADCLVAIKQAVDADWPSIARAEIVKYAQRLNSGRKSA